MPAVIAHRLQGNVSFEAGALGNAFSIAFKAVVGRARVQPGDVVIVLGSGGIGLAVAQIASQVGATVVVLGLASDARRLALVGELGIGHAINVETDDPRASIHELTGGYGADIAVECSGAPAAIQSGLSLLRSRGTLIQVGLPTQAVAVDFSAVCQREISVLGSIGHGWDEMERVSAMLASGELNGDVLVTHSFGLEDWEQAFDAMEAGAGIRVVIRPNGVERG